MRLNRMGLGLSAAVLAGGQSRRMGTDKALLEMGGKPLLQHALDAVGAVADDVAIVGDRDPYHAFGVRVVPDAYPGAGTLGGIATALESARSEYVLVVACDMPLLSVRLLEAMAAEPHDYDVLIPVTAGERSSQGGRQTFETLHAIYSRESLGPIRRRLTRGQLKVIGFLEDVRVRVLDEEWLRALDADLRSFLNANDPDELERIRAVFARRWACPEDGR